MVHRLEWINRRILKAVGTQHIGAEDARLSVEAEAVGAHHLAIFGGDDAGFQAHHPAWQPWKSLGDSCRVSSDLFPRRRYEQKGKGREKTRNLTRCGNPKRYGTDQR